MFTSSSGAPIGAVFGSWMNQRAITYRRLHDIPAEWGTAVNVQAMVFGNMGEDCATGVAFTRNPSTGENAFYGEYLVNAQGEDVVAGIRTPQHLTIAGKLANKSDLPSMEEVMPEVFEQLDAVRLRLEGHYSDMQDIEFTVQQSKLYMLQTRTGKRTGGSRSQDRRRYGEGRADRPEEAIQRIDPASLDQLLHPTLDPKAPAHRHRARPAGLSRCRIGQAGVQRRRGRRRGSAMANVILCRIETSPEDIDGMHAARGILTARGGMTSHAAVVARGMGRACVAGAGDLRIDYKGQTVTGSRASRSRPAIWSPSTARPAK